MGVVLKLQILSMKIFFEWVSVKLTITKDNIQKISKNNLILKNQWHLIKKNGSSDKQTKHNKTLPLLPGCNSIILPSDHPIGCFASSLRTARVLTLISLGVCLYLEHCCSVCKYSFLHPAQKSNFMRCINCHRNKRFSFN